MVQHVQSSIVEMGIFLKPGAGIDFKILPKLSKTLTGQLLLTSTISTIRSPLPFSLFFHGSLNLSAVTGRIRGSV